jgi:hypothetical protein
MKHYVHFSQQADTEAAQAVSRRLRTVVRKSKTEPCGRDFVSRNEVSAPGLLISEKVEARVGFEPRRLIARK